MPKGTKKKKPVQRPAQEPGREGTVLELGPVDDCNVTIPENEEIVAPEPISEEVSEVVEPAAAEKCEASDVPTSVCDPGIIEYVQPVDRYVTLHILLKRNGANLVHSKLI